MQIPDMQMVAKYPIPVQGSGNTNVVIYKKYIHDFTLISIIQNFNHNSLLIFNAWKFDFD